MCLQRAYLLRRLAETMPEACLESRSSPISSCFGFSHASRDGMTEKRKESLYLNGKKRHENNESGTPVSEKGTSGFLFSGIHGLHILNPLCP